MRDWDVGDPVINAWTLLRQASRAVDRVVEAEMDAYRTTMSQVELLNILRVSSVPLTPGDLASYTAREKHSVSEMLSRMERAGYIKKVKGRRGRGSVEVVLQPAGRDLLSKALTVGSTQAYWIVRSSLSPEEIDRLSGLLKKVRDGALAAQGLQPESLPDTIDVPGMLIDVE